MTISAADETSKPMALDDACQRYLGSQQRGRPGTRRRPAEQAGPLHLQRRREDGQQAALHRVLDHYLHTYYAADLLMNTSRDPITLAPLQPGVIPESFTSLGAARTWCLDEYPALAAAVTQAARGGFSSHAWQISWAAETFVHRRASRQDFASVQEVLHGLSSGDFVPALGQFFGSSARCRRR
jgi:hypothetical protein